MTDSHWKNTSIYQTLKARTGASSENVKNLLQRPEVMDTIENILNKAGSTPKNFTLHDSAHSFRVAEQMWEIIPDETKEHLSDYELGLLLLSAYLHDIGMSPDFDRLDRHKEYLTTDEKDRLSEEEIEEFQKWIDNIQEVDTINITKEKITDANVSDKLLAYYIRHKHNDWSGEWIRENLETTKLAGYEAWTDDLILICQSHHEGIKHLEKPAFDPKPVAGDDVVHPRYLAMCLRVADVMENDPGRTPEVILKHRSISSDSIKYWEKDHYFRLTRGNGKFTVYARPERAYLHKAIEETAKLIEDELKLCSELTSIKPLNLSSFKKLDYYKWQLEPFIKKDIEPKHGIYEYIQGAFRPNTAKLLELLGGHQLYEDPIWAYRELIQNAFDAVKERIAYQIVNGNQDPEEYLPIYGKLYSINIKLEKREHEYWLVCKDEGVGMTKNIIESYFLESGASKRHEISALERRCNEKGFIFSRTGQFGIGVLSYFMLADKVVVKTKRVQSTGYHDEEAIGWYFEINGTHDFGELKKSYDVNPGTEISFKLKENIAKDIQQWDEKFCSFLKNDIAVTPCNLNYSSIGKNQQNISYGWTKTLVDIKSHIVQLFRENLTEKEYGLVSAKRKNEIKDFNLSTKAITKEFEETLNFMISEGEVPDIGKYRIHIPYFKLKGGNSFLYLKEDIQPASDIIHIIKVKNGYWWKPNHDSIYLSLKGVCINKGENENNYKLDLGQFGKAADSVAYIEFDVQRTSKSNLSVSRHSLTPDTGFAGELAFINSKVEELIQQYKDSLDNVYGTLNYNYTLILPKSEFWFQINENIMTDHQYIIWARINYPIYEFDYRHFEEVEFSKYRFPIKLKFGKKQMTYLNEDIPSYTSSSRGNLHYYVADRGKFGKQFTLGWLADSLREKSGINSLEILEGLPSFNREGDPYFLKFPESWHKIIMSLYPTFGLNNQYFLMSFYDSMIYDEISELHANRPIIRISKKEIINKRWALALLLYVLQDCYDEDNWIAYCENHSEVIQHVFDTLSLESTYILDDDDVIEVALNRWGKLATDEEREKIRPTTNIEDFIVSEM